MRGAAQRGSIVAGELALDRQIGGDGPSSYRVLGHGRAIDSPDRDAHSAVHAGLITPEIYQRAARPEVVANECGGGPDPVIKGRGAGRAVDVEIFEVHRDGTRLEDRVRPYGRAEAAGGNGGECGQALHVSLPAGWQPLFGC